MGGLDLPGLALIGLICSRLSKHFCPSSFSIEDGSISVTQMAMYIAFEVNVGCPTDVSHPWRNDFVAAVGYVQGCEVFGCKAIVVGWTDQDLRC